MIKKIIVSPRNEMEFYIERSENPVGGKWAYISIYSSLPIINSVNTELLLKAMGCEDYLFLKFDDLTKVQYQTIPGENHYILFNKDHAQKILDFIEKVNAIDNIEALIVQCAAGISRSGAVGLFLNRLLKLDDQEFRENNKHILPNPYVMDILSEISKINVGYEDFWKMQDGALVPTEIATDRIFF
jgi:predicted protein tyrosine phosphatase